MIKDLFYFPGWTRKSITFTIDDGNVPLDMKFMGYVKPAGIRGTFNISTPLFKEFSAGDYRRIYEGYEIANHCRYHAYPFTPKLKRELKEVRFDEETADEKFIYPAGEEGLYRIHTYAWCYQATDDKFMECVDSCSRELEGIFGEGSVRDFIWPCGEQENPEVFRRLKAYGFRSLRITGCVEDSTGFAFPSDRYRWSYNVNYTDMTEIAEKYENYPDDGTLKFFCFGVHSHDFENAGRWDVLEDFCRKYGNRPEDYWYATVGELFAYEDAANSVYEENGAFVNPSSTDLYVRIKGENKILKGGSRLDQ